MKSFKTACYLAAAVALLVSGCAAPKTEQPVSESKSAGAGSLAAKIQQFASTDITADTSHLSEGDRKALDKLIEAARLLDPLYLRQVWSGNEALLKKLQADTSPEGQEKL